MTSRNTWKNLERKAAKTLGGERNPLSGSSSRHTSGDVIHDRFYVECKYRQHWTITTMFEDVRTKAKAEGKIPLLIIKEKSKHGELVVMDIRDFQSFEL